MIALIFLLIQLLLAVLFLFLSIALFTGAPFVPSKKKTAEQMIAVAHIKSTDTVYDLGSGDGRLLFLAAKKFPKKIVGIEINLLLVFLTRMRCIFSPYRSRLFCVWGNFWNIPLQDADVVFVYLLPWKMEALQRKLLKELKPGARIVSNSFQFPDLKILTTDNQQGIYLYKR